MIWRRLGFLKNPRSTLRVTSRYLQSSPSTIPSHDVPLPEVTRRWFPPTPGRCAKQFFDLLGAAGCARIALVTADLAASYRKAVAARVPQARVVYDRFHVERLAAADAVDEVRRTEQRRLGKTSRKALKRTRYALLKHPARLKPGGSATPGEPAPAEPGPGSCLRVEGMPGDNTRAGQARRGRRAARAVAGLGGAVTSGAVRSNWRRRSASTRRGFSPTSTRRRPTGHSKGSTTPARAACHPSGPERSGGGA